MWRIPKHLNSNAAKILLKKIEANVKPYICMCVFVDIYIQTYIVMYHITKKFLLLLAWKDVHD